MPTGHNLRCPLSWPPSCCGAPVCTACGADVTAFGCESQPPFFGQAVASLSFTEVLGSCLSLLLLVPPAAGLSLEWLPGTASLICSKRTPAASLTPPPSLAVIPEGSFVTLSVPFI